MGRAIVREPAAFLIDEPLSNLDAKLRVQMRTEIARLQHRLGTTTVYVTHDQTEAMTLGDRVAVMRRGVVQQVGTPRELYNDPVNLFVAGFIGSPAMNFLPARGRWAHARSAHGRPGASRRDGGGRGLVPASRRSDRRHPARELRGRRAGRRRASATASVFSAEIDVIEWLGSELYAYFGVEAGGTGDVAELAELAPADGPGRGRTEVVARLDAASKAVAGKDQDLWVDSRHVHLFDPDTGENLTRRNVDPTAG